MPDRVPDNPVTELASPAHVPAPAAARLLYPYVCRATAAVPSLHIHAGDTWIYATGPLPGGIVRVLCCGPDDVIVRVVPSRFCTLSTPATPEPAPPPPAPPSAPAAPTEWDTFLDALTEELPST